MAATPTDVLIAEAACVQQCVPEGMQWPVLIALFAEIAGMAVDTKALIAGAECIQQCIPSGMQLAVLISLADQINQGGGTGGATCLSRSVGPPVIPPPASCPTAINLDDTGGMWWYDTGTAAWIQFA